MTMSEVKVQASGTAGHSSDGGLSNKSRVKETSEDVENIKIRRENEFLFTYQEEPHRSRRMEIIKAHPEVTKLVGHEPLTKWIVVGVVALQFSTAWFMRGASFSSWYFWAAAYFIGATCNSNIFLAIHELSHNLAFKKPLHNKLFAIFANIPIGIPYSAGFGPYHQLHHKHMGEPDYDTDLPTSLEAMFLSSVAGKAFFATFQLLFYAIRPMCVIKVNMTWVHYLNIAVQLAVDALFIKLVCHDSSGSLDLMPFYYLLLSAFLAGSLHPIAGHFIAEHYVLDAPKEYDLKKTALPETYSYYGWLNVFVYNAGYHNEHHDFPYIPWSRIKTLHTIASEFYDPLPSYTSWIYVIYRFVFDENVSLWCRVKRSNIKANKGDDQP
ncbi:sphingolipid delta-4 desaturase [Sugiyamaella lignohabitans]|uniref:sphingolipid 4-desaturase n=1 Tax=Sugiyamaella lignohabitans TaxID=796027 RepID=A0A167E5R9_9ASCO|nr:sphingolipid delta-4 desaturase [Sugiyamaella lignohabitans]ANB13675.1 sphingolipid delta-4 desaturase [Sugiyamaella lignohabitans]